MPHTTQIDLFFRYTVKDEARFEQYLNLIFPLTQEEPYVLEYHIFRGTDGTMFQHERYENEEAVGKHLTTTAEAQAAFNEATEYIDFRAVGALSDEFTSLAKSMGLPATWWERFRSVDR